MESLHSLCKWKDLETIAVEVFFLVSSKCSRSMQIHIHKRRIVALKRWREAERIVHRHRRQDISNLHRKSSHRKVALGQW
jgi:hypothetical protein